MQYSTNEKDFRDFRAAATSQQDVAPRADKNFGFPAVDRILLGAEL